MKHLGTKTLETKRLILRPFTTDDAQAMYDNWASDEDVTRFLTWPAHESVEITKMVLSDWVSHYGEGDFYQWAIALKEGDIPVGSISVVEYSDRAEKAQVGYCIGKNWWHQGITSEALQAVIDFLMDEVRYSRVEAIHDPENPNSGRVMRKCGMQYEGTQRRSIWCNQGNRDACWYAILADDRRVKP